MECVVERSSGMPLLRLAYYNRSVLETRQISRSTPLLLLVLVLIQALGGNVNGQENSTSAFANNQLQREQNELERVRQLVDNGTLPRAKLKEAEERVADARDQDTLSKTLYGNTPVEKMMPADAAAMRDAAGRRIERQRKIVNDRRMFFESGALARTDVEAAEAELQLREQTLELVNTRLRLLEDLKRMAESERLAERLANPGLPNMHEAIARGAVTRFNGTTAFDPDQLPRLSAQYKKKFGQPLPISAIGETAVHRALGLDHRGRADIALNPDSPEGVWLRQLLEKSKLPYLAFRSAVIGAATAPHIHIGLGSARLQAGS